MKEKTNDSNHNIEMIDISLIKISNPRPRNKFIHQEIQSNIDISGLRKPITVRRIKDKKYKYSLICGQGRMEAIYNLSNTHIPAIIKDVNEEDGYIMSLSENVARRKPRVTELYERIRDMKNNGICDHDIASIIGYSVSWVKSVILLLEKGEQKLLTAVERGHIPIYLAVKFARSDDKYNQNLLIDAYNDGSITNKNIATIKKILEKRSLGSKGGTSHDYIYHKNNQNITPQELLSIYKKNVEEHRLLQAKSEYVIDNLVLAKQIISELLLEPSFNSILITENLTKIPSIIMDTAKPHED
ncbi:ParB N-terminal domain-containing protein [Xenorhabdus bovienii]|uniref:ParB family protein n=1 Tax=Xenorhabdus bovienii str. feltiae Moldova TaxID=1398200 RepID=A0A077NC77_XENBV|nr:ParB N-terminal domain-containing protein [Xenorhabdus bovienii]MCG3469741.1 ParB N-terminal domain-containing protein [Xenorhabdus bovienii]CDG89521.1 ParB family protein [Xenorhabdus bovienii str. feltiae France]CDG92348.1 ParB family protein [Xenorhabdus bovienii str. feltiae Florida]CDG99767.1 ParB family protein [Xenorhabdus bovienii str. feltiae Moldova]